MIRGLDSDSTLFLQNLKWINERLGRAEREVASGKRVTAPSDEPDSVSSLLEARAGLARLEQVAKNLNRVKTEVDAAESSLQSAVRLFDRVRSLGVTGANGTQTAETRKGLAGEIASIMDRMVALANTEVDGRFIFSGNDDLSRAYDLDFTQTPPWSAYQGSPAARMIEHPTGTRIRVAMDASEIFDNPGPSLNVFQAMEDLRQALLSNDDDAIHAAQAPLAGVGAHLNSSLTFYGNVQAQVGEAAETASRLQVRTSTEIGNLEDADITEAIVTVQQLKFTQEAAFSLRASVPRRSLFDYLG
jgi:flagellar hook-associated protein 3 FlgL